jgi:hypothetical protein
MSVMDEHPVGFHLCKSESCAVGTSPPFCQERKRMGHPRTLGLEPRGEMMVRSIIRIQVVCQRGDGLEFGQGSFVGRKTPSSG